MSFFNDDPFGSSFYMNGININKDRQDEYFKRIVLERLELCTIICTLKFNFSSDDSLFQALGSWGRGKRESERTK